MNKDILFVTAYKDINRSKWPSISRSNNEYFQKFKLITETIKHTLIVFVEDDIKLQLIQQYNFPSNILFYNLNTTNSFFNNHLLNQIQIIESETYKDKIPSDRKSAPEHNYAEYNLINHSKINFIREAKDLYPDYSFYSWIDFGFGKTKYHYPTIIENVHLLPRKIIYQLYTPIPEIKISPNDMLKEHRIFFIGSSYIIPNEMINTFENIYKLKMLELEKDNIVDDDQNMLYQIYYDYPDMFYLINNSDWFSFYNLLPNKI